MFYVVFKKNINHYNLVGAFHRWVSIGTHDYFLSTFTFKKYFKLFIPRTYSHRSKEGTVGQVQV